VASTKTAAASNAIEIAMQYGNFRSGEVIFCRWLCGVVPPAEKQASVISQETLVMWEFLIGLVGEL
jgi:hypothetical protein